MVSLPAREDRQAVRSPLALAVLAGAAFVYVTAETLPVGLQPQLSAGLHTSDGAIGLLVTAYAGVAGLAALPVTAMTDRWSRRLVVVTSVALLALSQFVIALAPDYAVVMIARLVCALAHGVFWSVLAPVATSLARPGKAARATAIVFVGNSLALVLGTPLATLLGQQLGWRAGMAVVGGAGAVSAVALARVLPSLRPAAVQAGDHVGLRALPAALRSRSLMAVCVITILVVTGHFAPYTYIDALVRHDGGLHGGALAAVLFLYGAAGIAGIAVSGLAADRRPRLSSAACVLGVCAGLVLLATLAHGSTLLTVLAVVPWGAGFTALPVCLQAAVIRVAPRSADTASALYVVAFQIGIGGGALIGSILVDAGRLTVLAPLGAGLGLAAAVVLLAAHAAFPRHERLRRPAALRP